MKYLRVPVLPALLAAVLAPLATQAQAPLPDLHITSMTQNGLLTFAPIPGYTNYVIQWAPSIEGPWSSSWEGLQITQPTATAITVSVPMFYRVVARGTPVAIPPGMCFVPGGEFQMGDSLAISDSALPVHPVRLSAFLIDQFEVTKAAWENVYAWAITHGYELENPGSGSSDNHPVHSVNWHDAIKWCNARSEMLGLVPAYYSDAAHSQVYRSGAIDLSNATVDWDANGYRLPTEAEWEHAARGTFDSSNFPWSSASIDYLLHIAGEMANFWNSGDPYDNGTTPVGFYNGTQAIGGLDMQNAFGLYDAAGNVAEFCWDRMATYPASLQSDPHGPDSGDPRVVRGGSWYDEPARLRCASRQAIYPHSAPPTVGLRCVRPAPR
jgi:formylglycine-generating enzyme required for sulfatase activity